MKVVLAVGQTLSPELVAVFVKYLEAVKTVKVTGWEGEGGKLVVIEPDPPAEFRDVAVFR